MLSILWVYNLLFNIIGPKSRNFEDQTKPHEGTTRTLTIFKYIKWMWQIFRSEKIDIKIVIHLVSMFPPWVTGP